MSQHMSIVAVASDKRHMIAIQWLFIFISAVGELGGDRVVVHMIHSALLRVNLRADTEQCRSNHSGSARFNRISISCERKVVLFCRQRNQDNLLIQRNRGLRQYNRLNSSACSSNQDTHCNLVPSYPGFSESLRNKPHFL